MLLFMTSEHDEVLNNTVALQTHNQGTRWELYEKTLFAAAILVYGTITEHYRSFTCIGAITMRRLFVGSRGSIAMTTTSTTLSGLLFSLSHL